MTVWSKDAIYGIVGQCRTKRGIFDSTVSAYGTEAYATLLSVGSAAEKLVVGFSTINHTQIRLYAKHI